jgi:hypothetical protein
MLKNQDLSRDSSKNISLNLVHFLMEVKLLFSGPIKDQNPQEKL